MQRATPWLNQRERLEFRVPAVKATKLKMTIHDAGFSELTCNIFESHIRVSFSVLTANFYTDGCHCPLYGSYFVHVQSNVTCRCLRTMQLQTLDLCGFSCNVHASLISVVVPTKNNRHDVLFNLCGRCGGYDLLSLVWCGRGWDPHIESNNMWSHIHYNKDQLENALTGRSHHCFQLEVDGC